MSSPAPITTPDQVNAQAATLAQAITTARGLQSTLGNAQAAKVAVQGLVAAIRALPGADPVVQAKTARLVGLRARLAALRAGGGK